MKKDKRNVYVEIDKTSGEVHVGSCNCPAGKSGYCNHVMALLFEIADYSFHGLKHVPEEIACTSRPKQWGVPGEASHKKPVALTTVQKSVDKRKISSTLYDPRKKKSADKYGERKLQAETISINKNIGFACCVPPRDKWNIITNTPHGQFVNGSPLSFHLNPIVFDRDVHTNICKAHSTPASCFYDKQSILLPKDFFKDDSILLPKWQLNEKEKMYLDSLQLTEEESRDLEQSTIKQSECPLWKSTRKFRITSSNAHKVLIRVRNFTTLVNETWENLRAYCKRIVWEHPEVPS